jgi:hypothetical protein
MAAALLLVLLCVWLDVAIDLPPLPRILSTLLCGVAGLAILFRLGQRAWQESASGVLARRLDRAGAAAGQILSGIDLLLHPVAATAGSPLTAGLAQLAVQRAGRLAAAVDAQKVIPGRPMFGPLAALAALGVVVLTVSIAFPRLASTQWQRFTDPFGDHPPYTRLLLSVEPGDTRVIYGGSLEVRANPQGDSADNVSLVVRSANGSEEKLPMFPEPGATWRGTLTAITAPAQYYVVAGRARSHRFDLGVITVPKIEAVRVRVTPPAYTHRPPMEGPMPANGIAALAATTVQFWAHSNRPLRGGSIVVESSQPTGGGPPTTKPTEVKEFAMKPLEANGNEVTGALVVRSAGTLNLKVVDTEGQASIEPYAVPLTLLRDERPFVRILAPKPESFATPDVTVNIELSAEDDYGISRLDIYRGLNQSRYGSTAVAVPAEQPTRLVANLPLPLADYGVSPGDEIKLYARVEDNDPAGAKGSESSVVTVHIISKEEMEKMMVAREGLETFLSKYQEASRRMEAANQRLDDLLKELAKADPDSEVAAELRKKLQDASEQISRDARELAATASEPLPFDLDKALQSKLDKAVQAMQDTAAEMRKLAGKPHLSTSVAASGLTAAKKALGLEQEQFKDDAADPLEHLAQIYPLIEDQAVYIDLYQRQLDLSQRMQSLQGHNNEDDPRRKARMRELEAEQRQIRTDLRQLLDKIDDHVASLPPDKRLDPLRETATAFAKAVRRSSAADEMAAGESALSEFYGSSAATASAEAAKTLERFLGKCKGMGDQASSCLKFQPKLAASLGNTVQELLDAAGLGSNSGRGMGGSGGYSARRNSLSNVGLYGRIPLRGNESARSGSGHADHGVGIDGQGRPVPGDPGSEFSGSNRLAGSGQSEAAVPDRYKRRVGEYFQRVSDELDQNSRP